MKRLSDDPAVRLAECRGYVDHAPADAPVGYASSMELSDDGYGVGTVVLRENPPANGYTDGGVAVPLYRHPQRRLEMADVVRAHLDIPHCPVLTSNQCHALAMKLNAELNK